MAQDIVYDAFLGSTIIRQVKSSGHSEASEVLRSYKSGESQASEIYGKRSEPVTDFETMDLYGLLGWSDLFKAGVCGTATTATIPWQKRQQCTDFAGAGANFSLTSDNWHAVLQSIECSQEDGPTAKIQVHHRSSDGSTEPISVNINQTLAALAHNGEYSMGPVEVNGIQIEEIQSWSLNPGITVDKNYKEGLIFPTKTYVQQADPTISLTFRDFDELANFTSVFTDLSSGFGVYLRKRSGTGFVSDATSQHIKIYAAEGVARRDGLNAADRNSGTATMVLELKSLSYSRASSITYI